MSDLILYSKFKPRYIPYLGDVDWSQIDRVQTLDPSGDFPSEDVKELGTDGKLGTIKETAVVGCSSTQREYGRIDFFRSLGNKASGNIDLDDFASSAGDICTYLTDKNDAFVSTLWYPKQRLVSFGLSIGDPKALVDRSFTLTGEKALILKGDNKYLIFKKKTLTAPDIGSGDVAVITLDDPAAVENSEDTGKFMFRVTRVRAGVTTELVEGTSYTSTAAALTVQDCAEDDVIKHYYSSGAWVTTPAAPFTTNDTDANAIRAHSVVLYIANAAGRLYKVQSCSLSADLTREDVGEIGNEDIVERSVTENSVSIDLGKLLDTDLSLEAILRGNDNGVLDSKNYATDLTFMIAVYSDATHDTFLSGYKITGCSVSTSKPGAGSVGANVDSGYTLKADNCLITEIEGSGGMDLV